MAVSSVHRRKSNAAGSSDGTTRLTVADLCKRWGVSRRTIERRVEDGVLPKPIMLGGLCWFRAQIEEFEKSGQK